MTNDIEIRANAIIQELSAQRGLMADRAAALAAQIAILSAENESLKKAIKAEIPEAPHER